MRLTLSPSSSSLQGSLWAQKEHAYRLRTWVVDLDNDSIVSRAVITAIDASNAGPAPHLGWQVVSGEQYDSAEKISALLVDEKAWAAVISESHSFFPSFPSALVRLLTFESFPFS